MQKINNVSQNIALCLFALCLFAVSVSVSLTTITYFSAFFFLLFSNHWRERWLRIKNNKAALSFWLLGVLFVVGVFYSTATPHLIWHDLQKRHWLWMTPFFIAMITQEQWRKYMVNLYLCATLLTLFLSYLKIIFHVDFSIITSLMHPYDGASVFVNHIVQSLAISIAAFICGYRFLFEKKYRLFYLILYILMGINIIFFSEGRTGYGIFLLLFLYLGLMRFGWRGVLLTGAGSIIILTSAYFFSSSFHTRMLSVYEHYKYYQQISPNASHISVAKRIEMFQISRKMIAKRPWFGYGTGGIQTALPTVVPAKYRVFNPSLDYVESIYLNFLLEFGVVGFAILLIAIALQIKITFQLPHNYRCLMQAVLITIFFGGAFNAFLVSFPSAHLYSLFAALCFSALKVPEKISHDH